MHPAIKGIQGAQSSGAAPGSFNGGAFCSYRHQQNFNTPVGQYAAFAYTAARNHLLADRDHVNHIGDTTVVCRAEGADTNCQDLAVALLFSQTPPAGLSGKDLLSTMKRLAEGLPCNDLGVDPQRPFYILGLAPNAARISVRFFLRDSFGAIMKHVNAHYERLQIVGATFEMLPLWALLQETVHPKADKKTLSPVMAGSTARAIFSGSRYPAFLLTSVMLLLSWQESMRIKLSTLVASRVICQRILCLCSAKRKCTEFV